MKSTLTNRPTQSGSGLKALYCSSRLLYVQKKVACQNLFSRGDTEPQTVVSWYKFFTVQSTITTKYMLLPLQTGPGGCLRSHPLMANFFIWIILCGWFNYLDRCKIGSCDIRWMKLIHWEHPQSSLNTWIISASLTGSEAEMNSWVWGRLSLNAQNL